MRHLLLSLTAGSLLAGAGFLTLGCASGDKNAPIMTRKDITSGLGGAAPGQNDPILSRTPLEVKSLEREKAPQTEYVVGPWDTLYVNVLSGQPDGITESLGTPMLAAGVSGTRVDGAGFIQLPAVRRIEVAGLTLRQIQEKLETAYKAQLNSPQVVVELLSPRSQSLYLVGQFSAPGVHFMDRPTDVLQALALGKGLSPAGDLRSARLLRDGKIIAVDLYRLLQQGDFTQNVWLKPGDTIYIPDKSEQVVFVMGDVGRPGAVPMNNGHLTLLEAFSGAGSLNHVGTDWKKVSIIRSHSATRGELIVVDAERILNGETLPPSLQPGDVVFVPRSGLGKWDDMVNELRPTLQLAGDTLQPFVQLHILNRK